MQLVLNIRMCEPHRHGAEEILNIGEKSRVVALVGRHRHSEQQRQVFWEGEVLDKGDYTAAGFLEDTFVAKRVRGGIGGIKGIKGIKGIEEIKGKKRDLGYWG